MSPTLLQRVSLVLIVERFQIKDWTKVLLFFVGYSYFISVNFSIWLIRIQIVLILFGFHFLRNIADFFNVLCYPQFLILIHGLFFSIHQFILIFGSIDFLKSTATFVYNLYHLEAPSD